MERRDEVGGSEGPCFLALALFRSSLPCQKHTPRTLTPILPFTLGPSFTSLFGHESGAAGSIHHTASSCNLTREGSILHYALNHDLQTPPKSGAGHDTCRTWTQGILLSLPPFTMRSPPSQPDLQHAARQRCTCFTAIHVTCITTPTFLSTIPHRKTQHALHMGPDRPKRRHFWAVEVQLH